MTITTEQLIASLRCATCPACGRRKKERQSFCRECYFDLSRPQREALYDGVGDGYEEAMQAALEALDVDVAVLPAGTRDQASGTRPGPPGPRSPVPGSRAIAPSAYAEERPF